jgi:molybdopterin converting factor small subunit
MTESGTLRTGPPERAGRARVLLFATARTAVGARSLTWEVPTSGLSVRDLVAELGRAYPRVAPILAHSRFFLDGTAVSGSRARVLPGAEFAVHPPYGGG